MSRLFCQDNPEVMELEAQVEKARPGAVRLTKHPFYPGGGGQLPDRGVLHWQNGKTSIAGLRGGTTAGSYRTEGRIDDPTRRDFRLSKENPNVQQQAYSPTP
jgi:Ser-tRNA(Ala) deacylase AlaX